MKLIQNQQKMLDILFANKNKLYGAYAIRSAYGETVFKSLGILCITLSLLFGALYYFKDKTVIRPEMGQIPDTDSLIIVPFKLPDELPMQKEPIASKGIKKPETSTSNFQPTHINEHAVDSVIHQENQNLTGTTTTTVTNSGDIAGGGSNQSGGNGSGTGSDNTALDLFAVDENPEFEGGLNALLGFVRKHVKYPPLAAEVQKQGTLYVKFVVDETGAVSQIELQNQLGYGLDEEAKRVVSMIPKFKSPGKVKGKAVKTYYQLPIKFKMG
jgi:periplasmic protein TonB